MTSSHKQRIGGRAVGLVFLLSASLWLALFSSVSAEVIHSFKSDIEVTEDGSFFVKETIVYDFEGEQKHGIYRNIKNTHAQPASAWYKERYIKLIPLSVLQDDQPVEYVLQDYDGLSLKIGSPNFTTTGEHTYEIIYQVDGALAESQQGTELYWNVTGNEWTVPILEATAIVRSADTVKFLAERYCYAGFPGSNQACSSEAVNDQQADFKTSQLAPGQEMTIAQALLLTTPPQMLERIRWDWFLVLGALLWFIGLGTFIYRWRFKYQSKLPVIAQYEPYEDFKPLFTGVLFDNRLDPQDISAGIVYLAQQGFISIKQTTSKVLFLFDQTDYEITLLRPMFEAENSSLKSVLALLFDNYDKLGNETVKLSKIKSDSTRQRANAKIISSLRKAVVGDLVEKGFLERRVTQAVKGVLIAVTALLAFFILPAATTSPVYIWLWIFFGSLGLIFVFGFERRTAKGFAALNHLKGFKDFLSVTEKERYKFHNAPALSPKQFMKFLPYAIAFGVEKEWAEVFKDIHIEPPGWYSSTTGTGFNAVAFTSGLGHFSTSFAGSTGSSGASGGGSSGGGSGGGGGGSW